MSINHSWLSTGASTSGSSSSPSLGSSDQSGIEWRLNKVKQILSAREKMAGETIGQSNSDEIVQTIPLKPKDVINTTTFNGKSESSFSIN